MNPQHQVKTNQGTVVSNPPIARLLFDDTRLAPVWLVIRVLLGWTWLNAGWEKLQNPAWMSGDALKGFWTGAVAVTNGHSPVAFDWYRAFLQALLDGQAYLWFSKLVAFGELFIGIGLIIGAFVGVAAFAAGFMNWNFIMAGSASINGLFFLVAVLLILAWKTAGYWGVDRYLLPRLGTPWKNPTPEAKAVPAPSGFSATKA